MEGRTLRKPFILALYGTSLSSGRLSGNLWTTRFQEALQGLPETRGPVVVQNFGKGSQTSAWGAANASLIADFNPTHALSEGFGINDSATGSGVSRPQHTANMLSIHNTLKAKNPAVDITWQTMNGVSAAGASLRPNLSDYYADEVANAASMGDRMIDNFPGWPAPLPDALTDSGDGLHPIWPGALETYLFPNVITWARARMADFWP